MAIVTTRGRSAAAATWQAGPHVGGRAIVRRVMTTPARMWRLVGADGRPYESPVPGALGGHRRGRVYGRLDCPSALRAIGRGGYVADRVFFADEQTAVAAGYRPCGTCMRGEYARWKGRTGDGGVVVGEDGLARCPWAATHPLNRAYHDTEWGVPVHGEQALLERISLEAFQSGLSWLTILAKRPAFREAFAGFDPDRVARFTDADVERLMGDARIVRNRAKIEAARTNARAVIALRDDGGLDALIWSHRPLPAPAPRSVAEVPTTSPHSRALAAGLKSRGFAFVGPATAHALMEAVGLVDCHLAGCHRRGASAPPRQPARPAG